MPHGVWLHWIGQVVAVLDTDVDSTHTFLGSKVVDEACFIIQEPTGLQSLLPGDVAQLTGVSGAGRECSAGIDGCDHGTHVAGIAAGQGGNFSGVAPDSSVIAVQVFTEFSGTTCTDFNLTSPVRSLVDIRSGCGSRLASDPARHLPNRLRQPEPWGLDVHRPGHCIPRIPPRRPPSTTCGRQGLPPLLRQATSNTSGISAPGCISSAIAVGATTDGDSVAAFSNSSPMLESWAPGVGVQSSVPGGGFAPSDGTSMATPHVAGASALLKSSLQPPPSIRSWLRSPRPVTL